MVNSWKETTLDEEVSQNDIEGLYMKKGMSWMREKKVSLTDPKDWDQETERIKCSQCILK